MDVGFSIYMNGNIVNGPNGIQYDVPSCRQLRVTRDIGLDSFMSGLCQGLGIHRNDGLELIYKHGNIGVNGNIIYAPIIIRSDVEFNFMIALAPPLPHTIELYVSQTYTRSTHRHGEEVTEYARKDNDVECEVTIGGQKRTTIEGQRIATRDECRATNEETCINTDDDNDEEGYDCFYETEEVPEFFTALDMTIINSLPDSGIKLEAKRPDGLMKGMLFETKKDLKNAVKSYSVLHHQHFNVNESKKNIWSVQCKMYGNGCTWRLRGACLKKHGKFEITQYNGAHTCVNARSSEDHHLLDVNLIAANVHNVIRVDPTTRVKVLRTIISKKYGYNITYSKAWSGKKKAIENIFGNWEESYGLLQRWMYVLETTNPGSVVQYQYQQLEGTSQYVQFDSVFWAFGSAIEGFRHCRPILQIDGTHLCGKYKGKLLIATNVDADGHIFPLAFAIVPEESVESWGWFLGHLWTKVVHKRKGICLISDRHHDIISAVKNSGWEDVHLRYCLRHIASNFNQRYKNETLKNLVYRAGAQSSVAKYEHFMRQMKIVDRGCIGFFTSIDPVQWTLSHDDGHRYGWLTTNVAESINGILKGVRKLPICALVQATFYRSMTYFADRKRDAEEAIQTGKQFTGYATSKLFNWAERADGHKVDIFNQMLEEFNVTTIRDMRTSKGGFVHRVKLHQKTCTCNKWQNFGIPCSHAIAVCKKVHRDYLDLIQHYYHMSTYLKCYAFEFGEIPDKSNWPAIQCPIIHPDPMMRREKGRPYTSRLRNEMDWRETIVPQSCGICGIEGHNRRKCPHADTQIRE